MVAKDALLRFYYSMQIETTKKRKSSQDFGLVRAFLFDVFLIP